MFCFFEDGLTGILVVPLWPLSPSPYTLPLPSLPPFLPLRLPPSLQPPGPPGLPFGIQRGANSPPHPVLAASAMALCRACMGGAWRSCCCMRWGLGMPSAPRSRESSVRPFADVCVTMAVLPLPTALSFSCAHIELDCQSGPLISRGSRKEQTLLW